MLLIYHVPIFIVNVAWNTTKIKFVLERIVMKRLFSVFFLTIPTNQLVKVYLSS